MGINNAETYDEAHDIADFIFSNDEKHVGFLSIGDLLSASKRTNSGTADDDTRPQLANAKDNGGPAAMTDHTSDEFHPDKFIAFTGDTLVQHDSGFWELIRKPSLSAKKI